MTNGTGNGASSIEDFAYFEQAPKIRQAREALRNFPINISTETIFRAYMVGGRYDYSERADDVAAWVLHETQKQCRRLYPDGKHPFLALEKLPEDYLRDSRKPPSRRALRSAARIGRIMRAIERRAHRSNRPVARSAGQAAPSVPRVRG